MNRQLSPLAVLGLAFTLAGSSPAAVPIKPGATVEYTVELPAALRELAAANHQPSTATRALCAVAVPANFDPAKVWPVLIVSATSDAKYSSSRRLMGRFAAPALAAGWIVVAADPDQPVTPEQDTNSLRYALIKAALAALELSWPDFNQWPTAYGGFSGGAKRSAWMAAMCMLDGRRPIGVFQGGCNEPAMASALQIYKPDRAAFLGIPVFLSSGDHDPIAPPDQQREVRASLREAGFKHLKLESYLGGHELNAAHVTAALRWFAELNANPQPASVTSTR